MSRSKDYALLFFVVHGFRWATEYSALSIAHQSGFGNFGEEFLGCDLLAAGVRRARPERQPASFAGV
jgi:hypothetical protein